MENVELAYSMFNQYLFQEAKNNIEHIEYYFHTNPNTMSNPLIGELVYAVKNYPFESIGLPLFQGIFAKCNKTEKEANKIMNDIITWKTYSKDQIVPARKYLHDICAKSILTKGNQMFGKSPAEYLKYLKGASFKAADSTTLSSWGFDEIDINSIVADDASNGVPSSYEWLNKCFQPTEMIEKSQLVMVTMPPGCFTGDTEIITSDGRRRTLEDIYTNKGIQSKVLSEGGGIIIENIPDNCILTKYTDKLIELTFEGETKPVRCTPEHSFLLSNDTYVEARHLNLADEIAGVIGTSNLMPIKIKSIKPITLEEFVPVYDLENVGAYNNFAISIGVDRGVFVHNCGKSLFAMSEALGMAARGYKVHYLAMGDLNMKDFIIRMGAMWSGETFASTRKNINSIYQGLTKMVGNNLHVAIVPADKITVDEYVEHIKDEPYDVLFIDYDSNFKSEASDNMYSEYGNIYGKLTELTALGKLVYILAQPKVNVWQNEKIELQDVGESSRKQHTVDIIITRGSVENSPNNLGLFKVVKNRRGGKTIVPSIRLDNGRFRALPLDVYNQLKMENIERNYTDSDIDNLIRTHQQTYSHLRSNNHPGIAPPSNMPPIITAGGNNGPISGKTPF